MPQSFAFFWAPLSHMPFPPFPWASGVIFLPLCASPGLAAALGFPLSTSSASLGVAGSRPASRLQTMETASRRSRSLWQEETERESRKRKWERLKRKKKQLRFSLTASKHCQFHLLQCVSPETWPLANLQVAQTGLFFLPFWCQPPKRKTIRGGREKEGVGKQKGRLHGGY